MEKHNIEAFVRYFESGCKPEGVGAAGMELEHFIVRAVDAKLMSYDGMHGVEMLLREIAGTFQEQEEIQNHLLGLHNDRYALSLEPAAQLEISVIPDKEIRKTACRYEQFLSTVKPLLKEWGYELAYAGYLPSGRAEEQRLIPKQRYTYMDAYFAQIGDFGRCMMRGTASVQVSVDYKDEEDFVNIYRAAVSMGPLLALLTDNACMFEDRHWEKHMVRTYIWDRVDDKRCGIVPGTFEEGFGFRAYADYLYHVPQIFQEAEDGSVYPTTASLSELCQDKPVTREQMEHAVSIVFPDVRLKTYVEIRVADSMPPVYAFAYLALIKGLFANRSKLSELYEEFEKYTHGGHMTEEAVKKGKEQLIRNGYEGEIYGRKAVYWLERMGATAVSQLPVEEQELIRPLLVLAEQHKSVKNVTGKEGDRS